ncbi:MAG: energy-coupled thiamine transporter ThiT [Lachnospiraceae bacterium]|nr:energy-coupled thiamine transporter ThiT [Lachnospiraceae bacterium]
MLRFLSHLISGATVWAGLSIPTEAALIYSAGYNATYMIPETIIMTLMAFYLGSVLDFRSERLRTLQEKDAKEAKKRFISFLVGGVLILAAVVFAVVTVFGELQDPESGDFMITGLQNVDWRLVAMVSGGLFAGGLAVILVIGRKRPEKTEKNDEGEK